MDKQYTIEEIEAMLSVRTRGEWRAGKHAPRMVLSSDIDKTPKTTIVCQCEQSDIADAIRPSLRSLKQKTNGTDR